MIFPRRSHDGLCNQPLDLRDITVRARAVRINQRHEDDFLAVRQVLQIG